MDFQLIWLIDFFVLCLRTFLLVLPLTWALWIGRRLGDLIFYIIPIRKKVVIGNLTQTFTEKSEREISKIARNTFQNFSQNIVEFARFPILTPKVISQLVQFENEELFEKTTHQAKGTICISGHFGNWEIMAAAIKNLGPILMWIL